MQNSSDLDDQTEKREGKLRRHFSFRINIFFFVTFVMFSTLIIKLAYVQFVEGPTILANTNNTTEGTNFITPVRGNIYDKNEAPIATSRSTQTLFFEMPPKDTGESDSKVAHEVAHKKNLKIAQTLEYIFSKYSSPSTSKLTAEQIYNSMDTYTDYFGVERNTGQMQRIFWPRRIKSGLNNQEIAYI
ncbi:MAG: penicillin-binding protein 2, partial [Gorillibacterium sp.]|nr:penicillin-binding protein 2 [Gorillibacterium sp.]